MNDDEINPDDFELYPEWKQALKEFIDARFAPGTIVPHEWFLARFKIATPTERMTAQEYQARQFKLLQNMDALRGALLEQHQIALDNQVGIGYRIVPAGEQTEIAMRRLKKDVYNSMRKAADLLTNTRVDQLTAEQHRERTDAIAKLAMMRGMNRQALKDDSE